MKAALVLLLAAAQAPVIQLPPGVTQPADPLPVNLDFEDGAEGQLPPGWELMQGSRLDGYSLEVRRSGCHGGSGCALLAAGKRTKDEAEGMMVQHLSGPAFESSRRRMRAWVKFEPADPHERAKVFFTVDRQDRTEIFQNKEKIRPGEWCATEAEAWIRSDAETIHLAVVITGKGKIWVDDVSFNEVVDTRK